MGNLAKIHQIDAVREEAINILSNRVRDSKDRSFIKGKHERQKRLFKDEEDY